jgi:hypothetical protein
MLLFFHNFPFSYLQFKKGGVIPDSLASSLVYWLDQGVAKQYGVLRRKYIFAIQGDTVSRNCMCHSGPLTTNPGPYDFILSCTHPIYSKAGHLTEIHLAACRPYEASGPTDTSRPGCCRFLCSSHRNCPYLLLVAIATARLLIRDDRTAARYESGFPNKNKSK